MARTCKLVVENGGFITGVKIGEMFFKFENLSDAMETMLTCNCLVKLKIDRLTEENTILKAGRPTFPPNNVIAEGFFGTKYD